MVDRSSLPLRLPVITLALLFPLLAACGGDDDSSTTTTTTTTAITITTTTVVTATTADSSSTTSSSTTSSSTTPSSTSSTSTGSSSSSSSSTSTSEPATRTVLVYFSTGDGSDCSEVAAFERTVDADLGPAGAAFDELVAGPTAAEEAAGAFSFFSATTAGSVRSVNLADGVLTVDFDDIRAEISNAGTSCGSAAFTSALTNTAFQFPNVDQVRFLFEGSCEDFGGFIQTDICEFDPGG